VAPASSEDAARGAHREGDRSRTRPQPCCAWWALGADVALRARAQDAASAEDLHDTDTLAWSSGQAERLRRVAADERVDEIDWGRVVEEIEDVGKSPLRALQLPLCRAVEHASKARAMPQDDAAARWPHEAATLLRDAQDSHEPGMARHIDLGRTWKRARRAVLEDHEPPPERLPGTPPAAPLAGLMDSEADLRTPLRRLAGGAAG
jgi:hypothetical protein